MEKSAFMAEAKTVRTDGLTHEARRARYGSKQLQAQGTGETVETLRAQVATRATTPVIAFVLFLVALAVYVPTATTEGVQANDTRAAAVAAYLYAETGSFAFPEIWPKEHAYWATERADGRLSVNRMPGVIATGIPAYAVARLFGVTPRLAEVSHPVFVPYGPAGYAAAVTMAAAIAVLFVVFTRLVSRKDALIAALTLAVTTPFWSVAADALWPHATTALALSVMLYAADRGGWLMVASAGISVATRPHLAVVPAVMALLSWRNRKVVAALVSGTFIGLALLIAYSSVLFGTWLPAAGYDTSGFLSRLTGATPYTTGENVVQALLNRKRGVVLHTPYVLVLLPAIGLVWSSAPVWTRRAAIAGVVYFLLQMRMTRFGGGTGFAQWRTSLETLVLFAPIAVFALVNVVRRYRWYRIMLWVSVVAAFVMTILGVVDDGRTEWAHEWWAEQQEEHAPA